MAVDPQAVNAAQLCLFGVSSRLGAMLSPPRTLFNSASGNCSDADMWPRRLVLPSLFFVLAVPAAGDYTGQMSTSYGQFCPTAKASEIFATRWTPLIVREVMTGVHSFNDIHRGVPMISRAALVTRLRELEHHGVIERWKRADSAGPEYGLTPAGDGLRVVMHALGQWGMTYTHDRIKRSDLDPALLIWGLRKRVDLSTLPDRRVVLCFEFSGVPASRTKFRIMWLVLGRSGVDVCMKDPGFAVDLTLRGNIRDYVEVYLGHTKWRDVAGTALQLDGDLQIARALPVWLRFETVSRLNAPALHLSAGRAPVQTDQ
jgi:DNA-binding HxlR family transcriptional regulator